MNIRKEIQQALAAQDFDRVVQCFEANDAQTTRYLQTVSYTHLTLPTILRV